MAETIAEIDVIALSGTTPGLTAMDAHGDALYPAILMLDQRSHQQARAIIDTVGLDHLLATTANMPVAGGCSLAGILWLRDNAPEVFRKARIFGHSNTYFAHWLTGQYAIDPSSASLTGLYNTTRNDCTWNVDLVRTFGLSLDQLPQLVPAYQSVGAVRPALARELGFAKQPQVLIGGNDAVLAAYSVGVREPGEIVNVNGTCEITLVCLPRCLPSPHYNIRPRPAGPLADPARDERRRQSPRMVQERLLLRDDRRAVLRRLRPAGHRRLARPQPRRDLHALPHGLRATRWTRSKPSFSA